MLWPPLAATLLLAAIIVLRFLFPETDGILLFAVVPIGLLGMMLGARAGAVAALVASGAYLVWAATDAHPSLLGYVNEPLTFFALGLISGYFARGALGDYDWRQAVSGRELRQAIGRGEVVMHYQPIVRGDRDLLCVEALARWQHPKRGLLPPAEFIPAAERDEDTIWLLTLRTLELAIADARGVGLDGDAAIAVNLSPVCLRRAELPGLIDRLLREGGLPAPRLAVEVTEAAIATGGEGVTEVLSGIKRQGVGMIAIDDFGVGHSSLARLARLPIDTLKIDRELVADLDRERTGAVVRGIVQLARALELTVVAEGVEDEPTWRSLRGMEVDAAQGSHLCPPLPAEELRRWLSSRR
jgi:EAL domain-containing protein (putative c-di-GMP-specific phosphodiesterase class I)